MTEVTSPNRHKETSWTMVLARRSRLEDDSGDDVAQCVFALENVIFIYLGSCF